MGIIVTQCKAGELADGTMKKDSIANREILMVRAGIVAVPAKFLKPPCGIATYPVSIENSNVSIGL
ncbi:MAG: hypothetical protein PHR43_04770 [Dehalococcoidales bacterium]|nr:hypothetical protein [Dehalococcoidales bacterium]